MIKSATKWQNTLTHTFDISVLLRNTMNFYPSIILYTFSWIWIIKTFSTFFKTQNFLLG